MAWTDAQKRYAKSPKGIEARKRYMERRKAKLAKPVKADEAKPVKKVEAKAVVKNEK